MEGPDGNFWAVLDGFVRETEHLCDYWTVEPIITRRAALAEIQALVETWLSVSEHCFTQTQQRSTPDREDNTLHSSGYEGDKSWWTLEESGTAGRPRASTWPISMGHLLFISCMCADIVCAF